MEDPTARGGRGGYEGRGLRGAAPRHPRGSRGARVAGLQGQHTACARGQARNARWPAHADRRRRQRQP
eukprot:1712026-Prymnesium_polylepis.1